MKNLFGSGLTRKANSLVAASAVSPAPSALAASHQLLRSFGVTGPSSKPGLTGGMR